MLEVYILDDNGNPKLEDNPIKAVKWYEKIDNRRVAESIIDRVRVSTVFLSFDHNFSGQGPPVLWETMIFGGPHDDYTERYTNRDDAIAGHAVAVKLVESGAGTEVDKDE
jgi:hypothetical protein